MGAAVLPDAVRAPIHPRTSFEGEGRRLVWAGFKAAAELFWSLIGVQPAKPPKPDIHAANLPGHPTATLERAKTLPGWAKLDAKEQKHLCALLGGGTRWASVRARAALDFFLTKSFAETGGADGQARFLRQLLNPVWKTLGIETPARVPAPYTLAGPEDVNDFVFHRDTRDAQKYVVSVLGQNIPLVLPRNADAPIPSAAQLADALSRMQPEELVRIQRVVVNPMRNPGVEMSASSSGQIDVYPGADPDLAGSLSHEVGHIVSGAAWGDAGVGLNWEAWKRAGRSDGTSVSAFGDGSIREDFAEAFNLYMRTKGTAEHDEYRTIFPERFAYIDSLLR